MRTVAYCSAFIAATASASFVAPPMSGRNHGSSSAAAARAASAVMMAGKVVVTDGTDSFFSSRSVFQTLHDYGDFDKITAFSTSIKEAKKMCISRQARYSGLIDVLEFSEGGLTELQATLSGAAAWVVVNGDAAALPAQLEAAKTAGVSRVFVHFCAESPSAVPDTAALASHAGHLDYTMLVTGKLGKGGAGGGLLVTEASEATCEEVSLDDTFRMLVEGLTISEASKRQISLRPTSDDAQLKSMRMAGCSRREECEALYKGQIKERTEAEIAQAAGKPVEKTAEEIVADERSEEEKRLAREEEVKALLQKAKQRGIENQKRMAEEEEEKKKLRAERLAQIIPEPDDNDDKKKDDDEDGDEPKEPEDKPGENPPGGTATLERPDDDDK